MRQLEDRYNRALAHPKIKWLTNLIPAQLRDHPHIVLSIISAAIAQGDPKLADDAAMNSLDAAARSLMAGRDLSNRIATAYHDPEIRAQMRHPPETYWTRPDIAYRELIDLSVAKPDVFKKYPILDQALNAVGEAQVFHEEHGLPAPAQAAPVTRPIPVGATLDAEIGELVKKAVTTKLSKAEDARLDELYGARMARQEAAADKPAPVSGSEQRYRDLIKRSLGPEGLTAADQTQLDALISARIERDYGTQEGNGHDRADNGGEGGAGGEGDDA
jgi:hypothetical protein